MHMGPPVVQIPRSINVAPNHASSRSIGILLGKEEASAKLITFSSVPRPNLTIPNLTMDHDFPSNPPFSAPTGKSFVEIMTEVQVANYWVVALATAWYYDLIITIPEDISLFHGRRFTIPDFTYAASKVVTLTWITFAVAYIATPPFDPNCHILLQVTAWLLAFATPLNAFLFLIRVIGIFRGSRVMVYIFSGLWLSTWSSFVIPISFKVNENPHNLICLATETKPYSAAGFLLVLLFDTAVFVAISLKVTFIGGNRSWRARLRTFFTGQDTGYISRTLMRSGQLYYLGVIGQHVAIIMGLVNETNPTTYRAVLIVATVALHNLMACKVYRLLKFDLIDVVSSSDIVTEQYGHNTIPDFAVREDSSDNTVIYLQTIPHTSNSRDLHSPMEFYTHRDK
ncbi:hypothetical protein QCA50_014887 [Cerrena zonata]|uniref:Transmembrane protein n=1 Tax=Cerrena zonata TaxID=2478898 RepID=A0AAW0FYR1_9APHY